MSQHNQVTKVTKESDVGKNGVGQYLYKKNGVTHVVTHTGIEDNVDQSQEKNTNLQHILEPSRKAQLMRHVVNFEGQYDDIPVKTFQDAMAVTAAANSMFEELPRHVKDKFGNSTEAFLAFVNNPTNAPELEAMGILKGSDGVTNTGLASGAPTPTDKDGDGIPDPAPPA